MPIKLLMPMRLFLLLFMVSLSFVNSSCKSTPTIGRCSGIDWFELGRRDGASGKPSTQMNSHRTECRKEFDTQTELLYQTGYNRGLVDYCSPENGFSLGRTGSAYNNVCPPPMDQSFLSGVEKGQLAHSIEKANERLDRKISSLAQRLRHASPADPDHASLTAELKGLESERAENDKRLSRIERQIN